jgi:hypothetical protein
MNERVTQGIRYIPRSGSRVHRISDGGRERLVQPEASVIKRGGARGAGDMVLQEGPSLLLHRCSGGIRGGGGGGQH